MLWPERVVPVPHECGGALSVGRRGHRVGCSLPRAHRPRAACPAGQPWVGVALAPGRVDWRQCGSSPGANTQVRRRRKHRQWGRYRAEGSEGRKPGGDPVLGEDWERGAHLWSRGLWRRRKEGLGVPRGSGEQGVRGRDCGSGKSGAFRTLRVVPGSLGLLSPRLLCPIVDDDSGGSCPPLRN